MFLSHVENMKQRTCRTLNCSLERNYPFLINILEKKNSLIRFIEFLADEIYFDGFKDE